MGASTPPPSAPRRIGGILIISRFEDLDYQISLVARRGVAVHKLMAQPRYSKRATDHRQMLFLGEAAPPLSPLSTPARLRSTFPNVPHEDSKDRRDISYDELAISPAEIAPPAEASAGADLGDLDLGDLAEVPEVLREPVRGMGAADARAVLAFFRRRAADLGGSREIVLSEEARIDPATGGPTVSRVVLLLDYESGAWKRVRRKAPAPAAASAASSSAPPPAAGDSGVDGAGGA